jgi:filamentous hemagglutinin
MDAVMAPANAIMPMVDSEGVVAESTLLPNGSFSISDWTGYPEYLPKPEGPFRLLEGPEYDAARDAANAANNALRAENPGLKGWEVHEIQPVKFGGSPTAIDNKIPLPPSVHRGEVTPWWNQLQQNIEGR